MSAVLKQRQPQRIFYQTADVEFDLAEIDDEDLLAELERRKVELPPGVNPSDVEQMFIAMKFGNKERALALLREYLMNMTGRVL